jgi:hypothetical protein
MTRIYFLLLLLKIFAYVAPANAQEKDSIRTSRLGEVIIHGEKIFTIERLPKISGTYLWAVFLFMTWMDPVIR